MLKCPLKLVFPIDQTAEVQLMESNKPCFIIICYLYRLKIYIYLQDIACSFHCFIEIRNAMFINVSKDILQGLLFIKSVKLRDIQYYLVLQFLIVGWEHDAKILNQSQGSPKDYQSRIIVKIAYFARMKSNVILKKVSLDMGRMANLSYLLS